MHSVTHQSIQTPCDSQLHLIIDAPDSTALSSDLASLPKIELPPEVSFLRAPKGEAPRLDPDPPDGFKDTIALEPVCRGRHPQLLLVNPAGAHLLVNDHLAPHVFLLSERDQIQINNGPRMELAIYHRPFIGAPRPDLLGHNCPVCRTPLVSEIRSFHCACGAGLHFEEGEKESALQCVLMTTVCPACDRPIQLHESYLSQISLQND